ncbi:MAG: hypothetical protein PHC29_01150 [Candidatus Omnitrophica bacterium]|nr:hypothetical protein [Candidatus Omnitrophota bacterium]
MRKILTKHLFFLLFTFLLPVGLFALDQSDLPKLIIFHSAGCHNCIKVKQEVMPTIENEFKGKLIFEYRDIEKIEDYKILLGLLQNSGSELKFDVPFFYLEGKFLNAKGAVKDNLRNFILAGLKASPLRAPAVPFDLISYFKSFVPATIIIAGLEDGINPCAFTVIVFFISFLSVQGYRRRDLVFIGGAFILAVFLTYLGIGLGIFNVLYHFKGFWVVTRLLNLTIGFLSLLFGIFAVSDFIKYKKTGSTDELILQLPKSIKERIHKVVGFFYRRNSQEKQSKISPGLNKLIFSALISGFLVSLLEAVCTGQVYLPTISFVLKASSLKLQALGYLLLYNTMFIIPLVVIFIFALLGTSSLQFSGFLKRNLGMIKIFMAILFFSLGVFLIWKA